MHELNKASLLAALEAMLGVAVTDTDYTTDILQGGTVGDVLAVSGTAHTAEGARPYRLVCKRQAKWERPFDPQSWRREYDIYAAGLHRTLPGQLRLPDCYLLETVGDAHHIWMQHVEGKTGNEQLGLQELSLVAYRLGGLQAKCHGQAFWQTDSIRPFPAVRSSYDFWAGRMKGPLSAPMQGFSDALRRRLLRYISEAPAILASLEVLPRTLCHGDVHHDNLFLTGEEGDAGVYLIDWDCAGQGYMGEDAVDMLLEAFVYSDRSVADIGIWRERIIERYCAGAWAEGVYIPLDAGRVRDIFALAWGFRVADLYLYYDKEPDKARCVEILRGMLMEEA